MNNLSEMIISKIKVAAYCRVSTDKEDQLSSLDMQKEFFEDYVSRHHYELVQLYADEGISGTKLKNRKAFNQMMSDAKKGLFERVFVKDISRFSRNAVDFLNSIRQLKAMGIQCDFVNSNLSTEDGEFTLGILALVAQEESANLSKRVKFGKTKNAEKGKVPNFVYGYDKTIGELFNLKINTTEADIIKEIFSLYNSGSYGANKIAQLLNERGLKTKRNCRWSQNAVARILQNPIYIGVVINGKEAVQDFLTGLRIKNNPENWHVKKNPNLAILSEDTFYKAQEILKAHQTLFKINSQRQSCRYPLSTLIKCSECGYSFRRVSRKYTSGTCCKWLCSGRSSNGANFCHNNTSLYEKELMEEIIKAIIENIPNKNKFIKKTLSQLKQYYEKEPSIAEKKELTAELYRLEKAKTKQTKLYESDIITLSECRVRTTELNTSILNCKNLLNQLEKPVQEQKQALNCFIEKYCKDIHSLVCESTLDNHILRQIIEKIIVNKNGVVEIFFQPCYK